MGTNNIQPKIFACTNSRVLAEKITKSFGTKLGNIIISKYSDGEFQPSYEESIRGTRIFIIGSTNPSSENLMELIGILENNLGKKAQIEYLPMQPGDVKESLADIKKSTEKLGYKPITTINKGIPQFIKWYKEYYSVLI